MPAPDSSSFRELRPEELLGALNEVEQKNAPRTLFVAGNADLLVNGRLRISIVGTREPTRPGVDRTRVLALELVRREIIVVSGLAKGIDTVAHRTAIEAGGRTIAVLGTPLDVVYPAENRDIQHLIMRDHLAVSQFAPGSHAGSKAFPMRNRTMALLSDATVIVEAGEGSGTLHQGWEALRLGRPLLLMQSLVERVDLSWPAEMLRFGAEVLTRENLDEVLGEIPGRARGGQLAF
ncbi:MAG: DNA-protecting protein DprA [Planctomycetes bacterium]|nr:DNA-protecting protein DprA [Planctomycetota bacterium]